MILIYELNVANIEGMGGGKYEMSLLKKTAQFCEI